jgi:FPC/CPF motif-containing protein YcgG
MANSALTKGWYYLTHWESWHWFAKYILLAPAWTWFSIRARSLWFFTATNPTITFGGFAGESKQEIYDQLPEGTYPKTLYVAPDEPWPVIVRRVTEAGLAFPIIAKPDSGLMGFMFRRIDTAHQLKQYRDAMPKAFLIQPYIDYPLEVSVFYYRMPGAERGTITGFVKKEFLEVFGDGVHTLEQLMDNYPRIQFKIHEFKSKHASKLNDVLPAGQRYLLSYALNLSRGGKLVSLEGQKDDNLLRVFDALSHYSGFLFGRYDIRCTSVEDLKQGKNYSILEFNGTGGEPHHVYGNGNSLWKACRILVQHWHQMYTISAANRRLGIPVWSHHRAVSFLKKMIRNIMDIKQRDRNLEFKAESTEHVPVQDPVIEKFEDKVRDGLFPCLAARSALANHHIRYKVADHMACPKDDRDILAFLYNFIDEFRLTKDDFYSAVVIFKGPQVKDEEMFEQLFWPRLQALANLDAAHYPYDARVDQAIDSPNFSFSLKEEAFYLIGLHPANSRKARRFEYPAIVFNAHAQFEKLRRENHYAKMQDVVRKRDTVYSGSVNPMLADFGEISEVHQYTGKQYEAGWKCPLHLHHARHADHSAS